MPLTFSFGQVPIASEPEFDPEVKPGNRIARYRALRPRARIPVIEQRINTAIEAAEEARRYYRRGNFHQVKVHLEHAQWQISRALKLLPRVRG